MMWSTVYSGLEDSVSADQASVGSAAAYLRFEKEQQGQQGFRGEYSLYGSSEIPGVRGFDQNPLAKAGTAINLQWQGEVWALGLKPAYAHESDDDEELRQLRDAKREKLLPGLLKQLRIQATPLEPASFVTISGEVRYPGEYPIPENGGLADVIALAGGLKDSASLFSAELARSELAEEGDRRVTTRQIALADVMAGETRQTLQSRDSILIQPTPDLTNNTESPFLVRYATRESKPLVEGRL
ncbi:SLBB domain-containing protein [Marinobacter sp. es.042]|uniref:SLBB domain-containing protein n=1 Tax=Marinobacter sp. es.042 TaxID=1761794 RepID=UPI001D0D3818|nr:SLBB domain-containing protein [Marinobacter sp. es.042]